MCLHDLMCLCPVSFLLQQQQQRQQQQSSSSNHCVAVIVVLLSSSMMLLMSLLNFNPQQPPAAVDKRIFDNDHRTATKTDFANNWLRHMIIRKNYGATHFIIGLLPSIRVSLLAGSVEAYACKCFLERLLTLVIFAIVVWYFIVVRHRCYLLFCYYLFVCFLLLLLCCCMSSDIYSMNK